jgi:hypothetical protein
MRDELRVDRTKAVILVTITAFVLSQPVIFGFDHGVLGELDDWAGTYFLVLFASIEAVLFAWVFGMKRGWEEMHKGADLQVPGVFYYVLKFITPVYAIGLLLWFLVIDPLQARGDPQALANTFVGKLFMMGVAPQNVAYMWLARGIIIGGWVLLAIGVWYAWRTHPKFFEHVDREPENL